MTSELHSPLPNYYEYLEVALDAPQTKINEAYQRLSEDTQVKLNNPWTMQSALAIQNTILPGIQQHLLGGDEARRAYDQRLVAERSRQEHRAELADDEGLDDPLRRPFFFDPFDGYDVEQPAFSLRQIASKLDNEWEQARKWIRDTSDEHHSFIGFLKMVAGRPALAQRIESLFNAVNRGDNTRMDTNEGIERCIAIFDPQIERAHVGIQAARFDGKAIDAGDFISDQPAQTEIILYHEGIRGSVFGTIESHTSWLRLPGNRASMRYTLMPKGTPSATGLAEIAIPLTLLVRDLPRDPEQRYVAELSVRMENYTPARELPLAVHISILPLPPRVFFEPQGSRRYPVEAGITHKNAPVSVVAVPRNAGDEKAVPLRGRISTTEAGASARPERFQANQPITLTLDNSHRPFGSAYEVAFNLDYGQTSGALGPATLYVRGVILPTVWQSMSRKRAGGERALVGCGIGLLGFLLGGGFGALLAVNLNPWLFLGLLFPLSLIGLVRGAATTLLAHKEIAGAANVSLAQVPNWLLWWVPLGTGLALALLCILCLGNSGAAFLLAGLICFVASAAFGFIFDASQPGKQQQPAWRGL